MTAFRRAGSRTGVNGARAERGGGEPHVDRTEERAAHALTDRERKALQSIAAHLGSTLVGAPRVPWGDSRSSYRVELADGRVVAAQHLIGPGSLQHAQVLVQRSDLLAGSGIAVATPAQIGPADESSAWILSPWVDGVVGAVALQTRPSSLVLADRMGHLAAQIARVDVEGLDPTRPWTGPGELNEAANGWLAALTHAIDPGTYAVAAQALALVLTAWDSRPPWQVGLSHGDFAPINVVVRSDGELVLLDLDDVQLGPRLLDVAWWGWVVRYHHPVAWARSWTTFVAAAGLEPGPGLDAAGTAVARVRMLERAARAPGTRGQALWLHRLDQSTGL